MYTLKNKHLSVSILDPIADVEKLGSRYCTGGYIWQISDKEKGDLLAGPHYPNPAPPAFDGQGAPDMFHLPIGAEHTPIGGMVMCIGVGQVRRSSDREPFEVRFNPEVAAFVKWDVNQEDDTVTMETEHASGVWAYRLARKVTLAKRVVTSRTEITNLGEVDLPLRWFPHPFFPIPADQVLCDFSVPFTLPENPGYAMNPDGFIRRKPEFNWARGGCYQALEFTSSSIGLTVVQKHDSIGEVTALTDYEPSFLPIWGNQNTFSFEPYLERVVEPQSSTTWQISYQF